MLGGCTGVQEDEPMPKDARIVKQEPAKQTEVQQTEVQKPETEPQQVAPVVNDPVEIDVPIEKPEVVKPPVQDPVIEVKPTPVPVPVQPQVREADVEYIIKKGDTYTKISKEDVDAIGVKTLEARIFDVIDMICNKKPVKALETPNEEL